MCWFEERNLAISIVVFPLPIRITGFPHAPKPDAILRSIQHVAGTKMRIRARLTKKLSENISAKFE